MPWPADAGVQSLLMPSAQGGCDYTPSVVWRCEPPAKGSWPDGRDSGRTRDVSSFHPTGMPSDGALGTEVRMGIAAPWLKPRTTPKGSCQREMKAHYARPSPAPTTS